MAENHQRRVLLFLTLFSCFLGSSFGYQFVVGGRDGWIVNPSENFNHWAERMRFQVNDTLLFQYKKGANSVLVVNKDDYDKCNTGNPIVKFDDGNSVFKFDRSGPFYFISGDKASCDRGQKLIIVVMAVRSPPRPSGPPTVVSPPKATPPSPSPAGGAPTPVNSPSSPSPASGAPTPANSPSSASPASGASGPATSSPSPSPASEAPGPSTTVSGPSPSSTSPDAPSSPITPGTSDSSPSEAPGSSTAGSGRPGDVNSPTAPKKNGAAPSGSSSIILISVAMSVALGGFMVFQ